MKIKNETVSFEEWDMAFVQKFGLAQAAELVLAFRDFNPRLPFLYDTAQLAHFLGTGKKALLNFFRHIDREYRTVNIKKKNGGGRTLHVPSQGLKQIQKKILHKLLDTFPVSPYATAYKAGSVLQNNAASHVGKWYLLKLDITDFFGSISFQQVYSAAFHTRYFPKQTGVILATLCCRNDVLPQGAPTSPALSNLVMKNFDDAMGAWCGRRGIAYTRYCDDMTFSADKPLYQVYEKAKAMLEEMGFALNEKKTRFVTRANRQSVTGLTVNEKVAVPRDYKRRLRQELYYTLKFGAKEAMHMKPAADFRAQMRSKPRSSQKRNRELQYLDHLQGKLHFILQIEPENRWFQDAAEQLRRLYKETAAQLQWED